jgi:hypothetical protein
VLLVAVFIRLNTAYTVQKDGGTVVVSDGRAVALKYVQSGAMLMDLLTVLPTILQVNFKLCSMSAQSAMQHISGCAEMVCGVKGRGREGLETFSVG